jgi:hypothetical protein
MKPSITFIQRTLRLSGQLVLPDQTNSISIAKSRYIQSVYEVPEYRNPDFLVGHLLPSAVRWLTALQVKLQLSKLRQYPFYYYLIARTRHYDQMFADAIYNDIAHIINIGCGADTRQSASGAGSGPRFFNQEGLDGALHLLPYSSQYSRRS